MLGTLWWSHASVVTRCWMKTILGRGVVGEKFKVSTTPFAFRTVGGSVSAIEAQ